MNCRFARLLLFWHVCDESVTISLNNSLTNVSNTIQNTNHNTKHHTLLKIICYLAGIDSKEELPLSFGKILTARNLHVLNRCIINSSQRSNLKRWEKFPLFIVNPLNGFGGSFQHGVNEVINSHRTKSDIAIFDLLTEFKK